MAEPYSIERRKLMRFLGAKARLKLQTELLTRTPDTENDLTDLERTCFFGDPKIKALKEAAFEASGVYGRGLECKGPRDSEIEGSRV